MWLVIKKRVLSENCWELFTSLLQASKIFPGVIYNPHQLLYHSYFLRSSYLFNNMFCTQLWAACLPIHQHRTRNYASSKSGQITTCIFYAIYHSWFIEPNQMNQQKHWFFKTRYFAFLNVFQRQIPSQCLAQYCREHRARGQTIFVVSGHGAPVWGSHRILPTCWGEDERKPLADIYSQVLTFKMGDYDYLVRLFILYGPKAFLPTFLLTTESLLIDIYCISW